MRFCPPAPVLLLLLSQFLACQSRQQATTPPPPPVATQLTGRQLATAYCGSCHLMPDPSLLPKSIWQYRVLPHMALRLGFMADSISPFPALSYPDEFKRVVEAGVFPGNPVLHPTDWQKLTRYYTETAPERPLPPPAKPAVQVGLPLFKLRYPPQRIEATLTLLRYDSASHHILAGNARGRLYILDSHLNRLDSMAVGSPPSDARGRADGSVDVLTMGNMEPNDQLLGRWQHQAPGRQLGALRPTIDSLGRPVAAAVGDLNQDGREDVVICQFGRYVGRLSWFEQTPTGYQEHLLDPLPGARRAIIADVNHDGRPDVVALLTQGDEQIAVYYNMGGGQFRKEIVLRFPSVYGSSYFDLTDMDHDGDLDILYTNGDNADKSYSLKAYHGVRVFLNEGRFRFKQTLFYPLFGAFQAIARDFDQDGDMDIAAISFFPSYDQQPVESFVYLENQGNFRMVARTFAHPEQGHWLVMDAADVDQDGDDDLLLGSFFRSITPTPEPLMRQWYTSGKGVLLLENRRR